MTRPRVLRLAALVILGVLCAVTPRPSSADTVDRTPFELTQPDGTRFWARQFGGPWVNGTETLDGYTVVKDPVTGFWKYADKTAAGVVVASPFTVGYDQPSALPKKIRRDRPADAPDHSAPSAFLASVSSGGGPDQAPQLGSRPTVVILVEFQDRRSQTTPAAWAQRFFGSAPSVRDYYNAASYGQFVPTAAAEAHGTANDGIVGWLLLNRNHPNTGGNTGDANKQVVRDALIAADPFVNFAAFDTNGDGQISPDELLIVVIVAGNEASFGNACTPNVWGHKWQIFGNVTPPTLDGKVVGGLGYGQFGEMHCTTQSPPGQQATIGIMVHEMGHLLGLPDLYDTDSSSNGIGNWSVMAGGSWNAVTRSGDTPALFDPWSKFFLSWVTPTQVTGTLTNQAIPAAATSSTVFQFLSGTPASGEYFFVENRQRTGYDAGLPGAGLVIWHIDAAKDGNREECVPGGAPACSATTHFKVAVVPADNQFDLERGSNRGDGGDAFPGTTSNRSLTDTTTPSSRRYSGATTGVSVTSISDSAATMTATLSLGGAAAPTLAVTPSSHDFGTVAVGSSADRTFTVQNSGGGTLSGSATVGAPFSIVSGGTYNLAAGATQGVVVRYTPTSDISSSSNVTFGVTGGVAVTRLVSGSGQAASALSVTPGSHDFGTVTVGTSADRVFVVQNTGGGTLAGSATVGAPFSIVSGGTYSLAAGASQNVTVRFAPGGAGSLSGTVTFSTGGAPVTRPVTGVGAAAGGTCTTVPITPGTPVNGSLADGDCAALNRAAPTRADRYTFNGTAGQSVSIAMSATGSFEDTFLFLMASSGAVVASNDDCVPNSGAFNSCINNFVLPATDTYTIEATSFFSDARGPYALNLAASGGAASALTVTPASRDFGGVTIGTSADLAFTVQNTGGGTVNGSASVGAPFSIVSGGTYGLAAGASQTVTVRFSPAVAAPASANVTFTVSGGSAVTRPVTGTGLAVPSCSSPITPGSPVAGTISDADCVSLNRPPAKADRYTFSGTAGQLVSITMQAPSSFVDTYVYLLGPSGPVVAENDDCNYPSDLSSCINNFSLPATGTYTIEATTFSETARGTYTLTLSQSTGAVLAVTPGVQDFGSISPGTSADRTFVVQNTGSGTLTGSAATAPPFLIVSGGTWSLGPGASQNVGVRFSPGSPGGFAGTVTFSSSVGTATRTVTGTAGTVACTTTPIATGGTVTAILADSDCEAPSRAGARADRYTFAGTAGQIASVDMASLAFDTYVFLLAPSGAIVQFNDDCPGLHTLDSCISRVPLPTTGTYVIEATSYTTTGRGSYSLALQLEGGGGGGGGCTFGVNPVNLAFAAPGGPGTITVTVTSGTGCAWTASSPVPFVTITSGASGSGPGTVQFTVAANTGAGRTATLSVAGQPVSLSQAAAGGTGNALDDFIGGLYLAILDRAPSASELNDWRGYLLAHQDNTGASGIIHTFFDGPEYAAKAVTPDSHVRLLYQLLLGRSPEAAGLAGWIGDLLRRFEPALDAFIDSAEFQFTVRSVTGRAALDALVRRFYLEVLGRPASGGEVNAWIDYIATTGDYRGAATAFFESPEYNSVPRTLAQHVRILYRTFLGREPEAGATAPWVSFLVAQRGGMADTFILSPEFQFIFHSLFQ